MGKRLGRVSEQNVRADMVITLMSSQHLQLHDEGLYKMEPVKQSPAEEGLMGPCCIQGS